MTDTTLLSSVELFRARAHGCFIDGSCSAARYFAVGRDGFLPVWLSGVQARYQSPHLVSLMQTMIALIIVPYFALAGAGPVLQLFSWFSNLATLCLILLMLMTMLTVVGYFHQTRSGDSCWVTLYLPGLSGVALLIVWVLAILSFDVLTSASAGLP